MTKKARMRTPEPVMKVMEAGTYSTPTFVWMKFTTPRTPISMAMESVKEGTWHLLTITPFSRPMASAASVPGRAGSQ